MKKLFNILIFAVLSFPLVAQEGIFTDSQFIETWADDDNLAAPSTPWLFELTDDNEEKPGKKPFTFARKGFEFGIDAGLGFDNDLIKLSEIFKEEIIIDLAKISNDIRSSGLNVNAPLGAQFVINSLNNKIKESIWDLGLAAGVEGRVNLNVPKSIFTLIAEGNIDPDNRFFEGDINAAGAVYAFIKLNVSAKFANWGNLRIGATPSVFSPLVFIPRSKIHYELDLFDTDDSAYFNVDGAINAYSPFLTETGGFDSSNIGYGFDVSLKSEYPLFSFLDVGGGISCIPIIPGTLRNRMQLFLSMDDEDGFELTVADLFGDDEFTPPELSFDQIYDNDEIKTRRPVKFDVYAKYKPFGNEFLAIRPNIGFSIDINNKEKFFNAGIGAQLNLVDLFLASLSTNYEEAVWEHSLDLAANIRVFELALGAALRSESFTGGFKAQGLRINAGLRFGW